MSNNKMFLDVISKHAGGVILLEGTRSIDDSTAKQLSLFGKTLAEKFPDCTFRSGNAAGTDQAFIAGVSEIRSSKIELVVPFSGHRKKSIPPGAKVLSLDELSSEELKEITSIGANTYPQYSKLLNLYKPGSKNVLSIKAAFLLRDIVKVVGLSSKHFRTSEIAGFHVKHLLDKYSGGTGFTIRVAEYMGVNYFLQDSFLG